MDLKKLFLATFLLFAFTSSAFAGITGYNSSDAQIGQFNDLKCGTGITCTQTEGKMLMELQGADGPALQSTLSTNDVSAANSIWGASNALVYEGLTADAFEGSDVPADVTADRTWTKPDSSGTYKLWNAKSALTAGTSVTLTVVPGVDKTYTDTIVTDNQDQTITFSGGGNDSDVIRIIFITDASGSGDEVITFAGANSAGTLTLANAVSDRYVVTFVSDGVIYNEASRTAIQVT